MMGKTQLVILLTIHLISFSGFAQEKQNQFNKKGILRAQGTISSGIMPGHNMVNIYLSGDLEYYISENISIRSDSYYFLNTMQGTALFSHNHSNHTGALYHFISGKNIDPYLGLQPGIGYSALNCNPTKEQTNGCYGSINPLLSATAGFNYYAARFFHLFMNVRYVNGKHLSDAPSPLSLNEIKISFGLGWNLRVKKS